MMPLVFEDATRYDDASSERRGRGGYRPLYFRNSHKRISAVLGKLLPFLFPLSFVIDDAPRS
jgi:hypothetical protein